LACLCGEEANNGHVCSCFATLPVAGIKPSPIMLGFSELRFKILLSLVGKSSDKRMVVNKVWMSSFNSQDGDDNREDGPDARREARQEYVLENDFFDAMGEARQQRYIFLLYRDFKIRRANSVQSLPLCRRTRTFPTFVSAFWTRITSNLVHYLEKLLDFSICPLSVPPMRTLSIYLSVLVHHRKIVKAVHDLVELPGGFRTNLAHLAMRESIYLPIVAGTSGRNDISLVLAQGWVFARLITCGFCRILSIIPWLCEVESSSTWWWRLHMI
jgi:hypothetical protein